MQTRRAFFGKVVGLGVVAAVSQAERVVAMVAPAVADEFRALSEPIVQSVQPKKLVRTDYYPYRNVYRLEHTLTTVRTYDDGSTETEVRDLRAEALSLARKREATEYRQRTKMSRYKRPTMGQQYSSKC